MLRVFSFAQCLKVILDLFLIEVLLKGIKKRENHVSALSYDMKEAECPCEFNPRWFCSYPISYCC